MRDKVGIPLAGINPPHLSACLKSVPGFRTSHVVIALFCIQHVIMTGFVNIEEIVEHHCLKLLSIINKYYIG